MSLAFEVSIAVTAGLATFFAPCAYALLPGYLAYAMQRTEEALLGRLALWGLVAGTGALIALGTVVVLSVMAAETVLAAVPVVEPLVGVLLVGFGVMLVAGYGTSISIELPARPQGPLGFGLFGAGYAIAAVGCVLPVFAGVIARAAATEPTGALVLLGVYVSVIAVLMVAATLAAGVGADLGLNLLGGHSRRLQQLAGLVLILAGFGQLYIALYVAPVGV